MKYDGKQPNFYRVSNAWQSDITAQEMVAHAEWLIQVAADHDRITAERMDAEFNARKPFTLADIHSGTKYLTRRPMDQVRTLVKWGDRVVAVLPDFEPVMGWASPAAALQNLNDWGYTKVAP